MEKKRRRWILHPSDFNESSAELPKVEFPTLEELVGKIHKQYGACIDFAAYFQQFKMNSDAAEYFTIMKDGRTYKPTTVPTGARQPPLFGQLLATAICAAVKARVDEIEVDAWIDNVRVVGTYGKVQEALDAIFDICAKVGVTINEERKAVSPSTFYT